MKKVLTEEEIAAKVALLGKNRNFAYERDLGKILKAPMYVDDLIEKLKSFQGYMIEHDEDSGNWELWKCVWEETDEDFEIRKQKYADQLRKRSK